MRFDVPAFGDGFLGAAFNTTVNRDLSGFDALTFYAKASQAATIDALGFGISSLTLSNASGLFYFTMILFNLPSK